MRGARCEVRGARCEVRGARCEVRGARCEVRGARCEVRGPPHTHTHTVHLRTVKNNIGRLCFVGK